MSARDSWVLVDIVARHAEDAAGSWRMRDAAAGSALYDLEALGALDGRVEANLDGLRIAGDVGWEICKAALADPDAGEVFVAAALALERADVEALADVLARGAGSKKLARGVVSALGWSPFNQVKRYLDELCADDAPADIHGFGLAGSCAHRYDPGPRLVEAARGRDTALKARALRTIGELGKTNLLSDLRRELDADDEACRFWAASSAALLGEPVAGDVLWDLARAGGRFAERAFAMCMRMSAPPAARARVLELARTKSNLRIALAGAAALGDPALLPWIVECMTISEHARFAGFAFTTITGVALSTPALSTKKPEGFRSGPTDDPRDDDVSMDPDQGLPFPHVDAVRALRLGLSPGVRHLLGKPMTTDWLVDVLRIGAQPARAAAAIELASRAPGRPLFEVRAPAGRQARLLSEGIVRCG